MNIDKVFIQDIAKGGRPSVSLTLLVISFLLLVVVGALQIAGVINNTGVFTELFYSSSCLYFSRSLNIGGKTFTSSEAEKIEEKVKA